MAGPEPPIYVESLQQRRRHWYTATEGDAVHRFPIQLAEIWNQYSSISDPPDPALLADGDTNGFVTLRKNHAIAPISGSTTKFSTFGIDPPITQVITATKGQVAPVAPSVENVLNTPPSGAAGYTPVIVDATGTIFPMKASEWVVDGLNRYVEFPDGVPDTMVQPFALTYFEYVGITGGGSAAPGTQAWTYVADVTAPGLSMVADQTFPGSGPSHFVAPYTAQSTEGTGPRLMLDVGKGATRSGIVTGAQWDDPSRGVNSTAFGLDTVASGAGSTVGGGDNNTASGDYSAVVGGLNNAAGGRASWAGGESSTAADNNSFVWSDSTPRSSTASDQVVFGAAGGFQVLAGGAGGALITLDGPVTMPGKLTVGGVIDPTGLVVTEQAAVPQTPIVSEGVFWVRNDGPNVAMFTDGAGTDSVILMGLGTAGGAQTLVASGIGPTATIKGLTAGAGITLTPSGTDIAVVNSSPATDVVLSSTGGTESLVVDGTGPTLSIKGLTAGAGISLTPSGTDITIASTASTVTLSDAGTGTHESLVNDGTGPSLAVKGLKAGRNISFTAPSSVTDVEINGITETPWVFQDQKASGTNGGTFTSGAWRTRTLTTSSGNVAAEVTRAGNQITLQPGNYYIAASAPAYIAERHQTRFYQVSAPAGTIVMYGTSEFVRPNDRVCTRSFIQGYLTIAAATTFELQHRCSSTTVADGFGFATGFGNIEVYATVSIWIVS